MNSALQQFNSPKIGSVAIHPGPIDPQMLRQAGAEDSTSLEARLRQIPLGRMGTTEDIAYGVLYLASDEASFVTGSEPVIDGGRTVE